MTAIHPHAVQQDSAAPQTAPAVSVRLTGERPTPGATPDSLMALHAAGYRAVAERLSAGVVLDAGCGLGFDSVTLGAPGRRVIGVDYEPAAAREAQSRWGDRGLVAACMDAAGLALASGTVDAVCSSHLIEHFRRPYEHVAEVARVLKPSGTAFFLTPNAPADFENPFHVTPFEHDGLAGLLGQFFSEVWVGGLDGAAHVKEDIARRRVKARRILSFDVFGLRHRIPRRLYVTAYTKILPVAYRLVARGDTGGATGITAEDFFVTDYVDSTTLVLFAVARRPRPPELQRLAQERKAFR